MIKAADLLPIPFVPVSDLLWEHAPTAPDAAFGPSAELLARRGAQAPLSLALSWASAATDAQALVALLDARPGSDRLALAALENPFAPPELATRLATKASPAGERAARLLGVASSFADAVDLNNGSVLARFLASQRSAACSLLATQQDLGSSLLRATLAALDGMDAAFASRLRFDLLTDLGRTTVVRWFELTFLEDQSLDVEMAKQVLSHDTVYARHLLSLCDSDALLFLSSRPYLSSLSTLAVSLEPKRTVARAVSHVNSSLSIMDQFELMTMAGTSAQQAANALVNGARNLTFDESLSLLPHLTDSQLLSFFLGGLPAAPASNELVAALIDALPVTRIDAIATVAEEVQATQYLRTRPWATLLARRFPNLVVPDDRASAVIAATILTDLLGDDAAAWDVVLSLAANWTGSFGSLVEASRAALRA